MGAVSEVSGAMQALYEGDRERAEQLLPAEDELDVFHAAAFGREARLGDLLAGEPELARASSPDGFTPLHLAAFTDEAGAARLLLGADADPEAVSENEQIRARPLNTAAFARAHAVARVLLEAGVDPNGTGEAGYTPLHAAAQHGDPEMAQLLLDHGADPYSLTEDGRSPSDLAEGGVAELLP